MCIHVLFQVFYSYHLHKFKRLTGQPVNCANGQRCTIPFLSSFFRPNACYKATFFSAGYNVIHSVRATTKYYENFPRAFFFVTDSLFRYAPRANKNIKHMHDDGDGDEMIHGAYNNDHYSDCSIMCVVSNGFLLIP